MRSRSNSTVRLDYYQRLVYKTILNYQVSFVVCFGVNFLIENSDRILLQVFYQHQQVIHHV